MTPGQYLFNFEGGERRDAGIERVDGNTPEWWVAKFRSAIRELTERGVAFTAEDVREICGDPPNSPNAFSSQMYWAVRWRLIYWTGATRECERATSHHRGGGLKVYRGVRQ